MPILNFTTKIPAARTVSEISALLARKGASSITQQFSDTGKVAAVTFTMKVGGVPTNFLLPSNERGVYDVMLKSAPPRFRSREQAERVSWRILKDWCEAQIALVESRQAEMGQVFMPYAVQGGRTLYEVLVERNQKQLGARE